MCAYICVCLFIFTGLTRVRVFIYIYRAPALQPSTVAAPSAARPSVDAAAVRCISIYLTYRCVCVYICVCLFIFTAPRRCSLARSPRHPPLARVPILQWCDIDLYILYIDVCAYISVCLFIFTGLTRVRVFVYIYRAPALQPSTVTAPSAARPSFDAAAVRCTSIYLTYMCVCLRVRQC